MNLSLFVTQECFNELQSIMDSFYDCGDEFLNAQLEVNEVLSEHFRFAETKTSRCPMCFISNGKFNFLVSGERVSVLSPRFEVLKNGRD